MPKIGPKNKQTTKSKQKGEMGNCRKIKPNRKEEGSHGCPGSAQQPRPSLLMVVSPYPDVKRGGIKEGQKTTTKAMERGLNEQAITQMKNKGWGLRN